MTEKESKWSYRLLAAKPLIIAKKRLSIVLLQRQKSKMTENHIKIMKNCFFNHIKCIKMWITCPIPLQSLSVLAS